MILNTLSCIFSPPLGAVLGAVSLSFLGAVSLSFLGAVLLSLSFSFRLMEVPILGLQKVTSEYITSVTISTFSPVNLSQE